MTQSSYHPVPVDPIPPRPVEPDLIDEFTGYMHFVAMGCKGGMNCKLHDTSLPELRRVLVNFMGKLLDAWEEHLYGDPLPEEERLWLEHDGSQTDDADPSTIAP